VSGRVRPKHPGSTATWEGDRMRVVYRRAGDQQSDGGWDVPSKLVSLGRAGAAEDRGTTDNHR
jgi:hypothetical protein